MPCSVLLSCCIFLSIAFIFISLVKDVNTIKIMVANTTTNIDMRGIIIDLANLDFSALIILFLISLMIPLFLLNYLSFYRSDHHTLSEIFLHKGIGYD